MKCVFCKQKITTGKLGNGVLLTIGGDKICRHCYKKIVKKTGSEFAALHYLHKKYN